MTLERDLRRYDRDPALRKSHLVTDTTGAPGPVASRVQLQAMLRGKAGRLYVGRHPEHGWFVEAGVERFLVWAEWWTRANGYPRSLPRGA